MHLIMVTAGGFVLLGLFLLLAEPTAGLFTLAIGGGLTGYLFYLMVSPKGAMVFSRPYQAVIAQTPHIRYRTSLVVQVAVVLLIVIIGLAIVGGIVSALRP